MTSAFPKYLLTLILLLLCATARSAAPVPLPESSEESQVLMADEMTTQERQALIARLSDEEVRALVVQLIETSPAGATADPEDHLAAELTESANLFRERFVERLRATPHLPKLAVYQFQSMIPDGESPTVLLFVGLMLAIIIAAGAGGEWLFLKACTPVRNLIGSGRSGTFTQKLGKCTLTMAVELMRLVVFAVVAVLTLLLLWQGHEPNRLLSLYIVGGIVAFRGVHLVLGALFSPRDPSVRLISLDDQAAQKVHRILSFAVGFGLVLVLAGDYLREIGGDPILIYTFMFYASFGLVSVFIYGAWSVKDEIGSLIQDPEDSSGVLMPILASTWPLLFSVAVVVIFVLSVISDLLPELGSSGPGLLTLFVIIGLPFVLAAVKLILLDIFRNARIRRGEIDAPASESVDTPGDTIAEDRTDLSYLPSAAESTVIRVVRIGMLLATVAWIASLWGLNVTALTSTPLGGWFSEVAVQVLSTVFIAYLLWAFIKRMIDPHLVDEADTTGPSEDMGGVGVSRIATLLPIFRRTLQFALVTITAMVILSALGVNIGPLLAGAGVIGLAIGFGAQTLIRDIISGAFFLFDDAFRRGEYIEVDNIRGTVERISLRSFQLRHHKGAVHTLPYGEIKSLTNYSRDWAIMKFELRIPFEEDVERVRKIIKKVGQELMQDEEIRQMLIDPLKSQGVNRMDDSAFIVRCKFTAHPGHQFYVRRIAYAKIQQAFEDAGIQFAPKRVIVEAHTPEMAAAGAAALEAEELAAKGKKSDDRG